MKKISLIMLAILCVATVSSAATVTISTTITFWTSLNLGGNSYKCVNMGDGSQTEGQLPFAKGSASLTNWTLLAPGVDGVHMRSPGYCNGRWADVGEDAVTKTAGTASASASGSFAAAADKVCQVNTGGGFTATLSGSGFQTFMRQNGGTSYICQLNCGNSTASGGLTGCKTCCPSSTCSNYGSLSVSCCKCFRP